VIYGWREGGLADARRKRRSAGGRDGEARPTRLVVFPPPRRRRRQLPPHASHWRGSTAKHERYALDGLLCLCQITDQMDACLTYYYFLKCHQVTMLNGELPLFYSINLQISRLV